MRCDRHTWDDEGFAECWQCAELRYKKEEDTESDWYLRLHSVNDVKIFVITLGERIYSFRDRMLRLINFNEFEAFNPTQIEDFKPLFINSDIFDYNHLYNTDSVIACAKSHFYLWKKCIELNETILILEDDAMFYNVEAKKIFTKTNFKELDFDVFYFDGRLVDEPYIIQDAYEFHSGVAYMITPKAAQMMINKIETKGFDRALDWELLEMRKHGLKAKSFNNIVIVPKAGEPSNIKL